MRIAGGSPGADREIIAHLHDRLAGAFRAALDDRLVALAAYGSSVDGSYIPNFSDFDLAVFLNGEFGLEDAIATQTGLGDLTPQPFDYLQTRFIDASAAPAPTLVPGNFCVFWGRLPDETNYLHDADSLRQSGREWLAKLPSLIEDDRAAWAVAVGSARRQRLIRLMMTRLKPALRALIVESGGEPTDVWVSNWDELAGRWRCYGANAAQSLGAVLLMLPPCGREQETVCGQTILRLLASAADDAQAAQSE